MAGPNDPQNPQGGTPELIDAINKMNEAMDVANAKAKTHEELLRAMAEHAGAIQESTDKTVRRFREFVKAGSSIEENYKMIVEYGKKHRDLARKDIDDSRKARKELEALQDLYEEALKSTKSNTSETKHWEANLRKLKDVLKGINTDSKLTEDQIKAVADQFDRATKNAKALSATAGTFKTRTGVMAKGVMGMLGTMGLDAGMNAKVERRLQQQQDLKDKLEEHRTARKQVTRAQMMKKYDKHKAEVTDWGGDFVDEKTGGLSEAGIGRLGEKMGFKPGSSKYKQFVAGETAGGASAGGAAGAGFNAVMEDGSGMIDKVVMAIEGGVESLTMLAPEIIIPIEILAAVIGTLTETYAKQNQEMEKKFGAGGMFNQPGVGAGEAFARARWALNPIQAGTVPLGITMERNMALAGAMSGGGFNVGQDFGPNAPNTANASLGGGETAFMKGGIGEAQRIVMGVSRVSGLGDTEGAENLIKLLNQYKETMASAENFMTKLNKDTHAAGISTTKYLSIIDQIEGAFDKMGKSLEQVTGVMAELSRYGSLSSESLHDMMEFLASGQQKTTMSNVQTSAYLEQVKPKDVLDAERMAQKNTLKSYAGNLNAQAERMGIAPINIDKAVDAGNFQQVSAAIGAMRGKITKMPEGADKQTMMGTLAQLQTQLAVTQGVMSSDYMKRGMIKGAFPENLASSQASLFSNLRNASNMSGLTMGQLSRGEGSAEQIGTANMVFEQMGGKDKAFAQLEVLRQQATNRVEDARKQAEANRNPRAFKPLFTELDRGFKAKGGLHVLLREGGLGKYWKGNMEDTLSEMQKQGLSSDEIAEFLNKNNDILMSSNENMDSIEKSSGAQNKTSQQQLVDNIDQARAIGIRTQTVEDLLKNIFQPLLAGLLTAVEKIATIVSKWSIFSTKSDMSTSNTMGELKVLPEAIDELQDAADKSSASLKDWSSTHGDKANWSYKEKQYYSDQLGSIATANQQIQFMKGIQTRGAMTDAEQAQLGQTVHNYSTYFSSDVNQQFAANDSVSASGDKPQPMAPRTVRGRVVPTPSGN